MIYYKGIATTNNGIKYGFAIFNVTYSCTNKSNVTITNNTYSDD